MDKLLLILDLDETLIHATASPPNEDWDFEYDKYKVYKRPHLKQFLISAKEHFKVAVWSSASDDYVDGIVNAIFPENYPLEFVWARSKCTKQFGLKSIDDYGYSDSYEHMHYTKILKKVKRHGYANLNKILMVDDTPHKLKYNYGNAIYVSEFSGSKQDEELLHLMKYLLLLKDVENVRAIEKRNWRRKEVF